MDQGGDQLITCRYHIATNMPNNMYNYKTTHVSLTRSAYFHKRWNLLSYDTIDINFSKIQE